MEDNNKTEQNNESAGETEPTENAEPTEPAGKTEEEKPSGSDEKKSGKRKKKKKAKSRLRKVINAIEWIILLASVGLLSYIFITTMQGKAASFFGYRILYVVTGSMEPTISVDDYVVVKSADTSSLQKGDIIAFYSEDPEIRGKLVIHRILEVEEDGSFIMKGDANPVADSLAVRPDQVVGKYVGRLRFLNWLSSFVSLKKILLLAVIIPMFLMSIYEVSTLAKFLKKSKKPGKAGEGKKSKDKTGATVTGTDRTTAENAETAEERIERLKREAIEEYLKAQAEKSAEDDVILSEAKDPENENTEDDVILSEAKDPENKDEEADVILSKAKDPETENKE